MFHVSSPIKQILSISLGGLIIFIFIFRIYIGRFIFTKPFDAIKMGKIYSESQYVVGSGSKFGIGDDGLYAYAGYYYLMQKGDVASINFEHPPLGKYLIGLSIAIFGNENAINIFYYIVLLFVIHQLALLILKEEIFARITVLIILLDSLVTEQLYFSLLDLPFILFFISAIYLFLKGSKSRKWYLFSNLAWGLAFSTRFFPAFVLLYPFQLFWSFKKDRKNTMYFILTSLTIPVIYLLSHSMYFYYHPSFFGFIRYKIWMLSWFSGSVSILGNIWRNIFTGYFVDTSEKLIRNDHWNIPIPIIVMLAMIPIKILGKYWKSDKSFLYYFSTIYFIYMTFLTNGNQKYLMRIYPFLVILALETIRQIHSIIRGWKTQSLSKSNGK